MLAAFLILGEQPSSAHYIGGAVLLTGIAICLYATLQNLHQEKLKNVVTPEQDTVPSLEAECRTWFKGV